MNSSAKFSRRTLARTIAAKLLSEPKRRSHLMAALAAYLVAQRREHEAELIVGDIAHELYVQSGQLLVEVTSARPLTDDVRAAVKELMTKQTGAKQIELAERIDASLIGGLTARTPDALLDVSVRGKLNQLATIK